MRKRDDDTVTKARGNARSKRRDGRSPFEVLDELRVSAPVGGKAQRLSADETLCAAIFQRAMKGSVHDVSQVLQWIDKREASRKPEGNLRRPPLMEFPSFPSIDAVLLLLGIVHSAPDREGRDGLPGVQLDPRIVTIALSRKRKFPIKHQYLTEIRARTMDADTVSWPTETSGD